MSQSSDVINVTGHHRNVSLGEVTQIPPMKPIQSPRSSKNLRGGSSAHKLVQPKRCSRQVSFVERLELTWENNNVFSNSLVLGDLDNDNDSELAVGSIDGYLAIYKGESVTNQPWKFANSLGTICGMAIGDVRNNQKKSLVVITFHGTLHVFDIDPASSEQIFPQTFTIPFNASCIVIGDVDDDGKQEIVIGTYDRYVYSFELEKELEQVIENIPEKVQPASPKLSSPSSPTGFSPEVARSPTSPTLLPQALQYASVFTLKEKAKWKLEAQAESLCISALSNFKEAPRLSKSVPTPYSTPVADSPSAQSDIVESRLVIVVGMKGGYSVIKAFQSDAPIEYTQIGEPGRGAQATLAGPTTDENSKVDSTIAICTLDGSLRLQDGPATLWEMQVDHQLFSAAMVAGISEEQPKEDIVVACGLDGMTFFVDHAQNVVKFKFGERVCAFKAGMYSVKKGQPVPCLVYVTFKERIYLYYNVRLGSIPAYSIHQLMAKRFKKDFACLKENQYSIDWTIEEQTSLIYSCVNGDINTPATKKYLELLKTKLEKITAENNQLEAEIMANAAKDQSAPDTTSS